MEIFVMGNYVVSPKARRDYLRKLRKSKREEGIGVRKRWSWASKTGMPKKKMQRCSTLSHFKGLMRECQKEYLVHLVLKGQFQRISRRSWVTERLTARCRSYGQFAIPLISDIDLRQFPDTWPRNMERNICQSSDNMCWTISICEKYLRQNEFKQPRWF